LNPTCLGHIPPPSVKRKKMKTGFHSLAPRKDEEGCEEAPYKT